MKKALFALMLTVGAFENLNAGVELVPGCKKADGTCDTIAGLNSPSLSDCQQRGYKNTCYATRGFGSDAPGWGTTFAGGGYGGGYGRNDQSGKNYGNNDYLCRSLGC